MPKIWHILIICTFVLAWASAITVAVGSSVAFVIGLLVAAGLYTATLDYRQRWARTYAASQTQAGNKRAGSTDGPGTGDE